ncbi:hypothetical protein BDZ94DRAFT_1269896 [Collybia nuda]|uniref:Rho-GAP domain-containing protein n=1 Tax=Collybia nuda TaxID=64659 RepID=A0A9P5XXT2_9AGAR|nr:hypothetical protein BDZ94DRAFT_1269896 [Collybia nuda]
MDQPSLPSRTSTSDPPVQTQGPIPLFDAHLRVLSDSYLSFFQERKRIEEIYVKSLTKLHHKIKSVDQYLDDRDLSTTRSAWSEVRDNVEREAQAREAFCATLTSDVITPLTVLKETQDRTRKRIKEDLKDSGMAYNEYAENILPRLRAKYSKKFAEVEEQKRAATAIPPTSPLPTTSLGAEQHHQLSNSRSNPSMPSRPIVTSPQPLRALDRRPSGSGPTGRNRSPSSSTAFSDLAHQGKRQLNQLIGFLDKGGSVKDSLGNRENQALRNVRTKREAEEADKEYRKGVHWLETLRLRRTKILEGGYKSLEMFVEESSAIVKKALEKYTDNMTATSTTQTQLSSHTRTIVDRISPEKDIAKLSAYIPRSLASAIPEPILYQHGQVGLCNDLIFGFGLVDYATAKGLQDGETPKIIRICIREMDQRGLESEGIYRVSGRHAIVQTLQHEVEKDESRFEFNPQKDDVYAVSSLLKLYLRELPEPVFKFPLHERIQHTEDRAEHQSNNFMLLRSKMRRLPPVHQATLKAIVEHLARVVAFSEKNKMDAKNLAIVFGSVIFGEDEMPKGGDLLSVQTWKDSLMEDLITNAHVLYDEHSTHQSPPPAHYSPPLPPTPAGEPTPVYPYGSKSTKVATVPPTPTPLHVSAGSHSPSSPQDFTPRLPPRPANSIHPSLRANPQTPTRGRADAPLLPITANTSPEQTPPPSPSVSSTVYETDEDNTISEAPEQPAATSMVRPPSSSTRPGMAEGLVPETEMCN